MNADGRRSKVPFGVARSSCSHLRLSAFICGSLLLFSSAFAAPCTDLDPNAPIPDLAFQEIVAGFENPTHVTHAGDGSGRLFVVEQAGTIRIVENGKVLPQPFLDIRDRVERGGEKGLLSVAFHPRYRENGLFYVDYTTRTNRLYTHVSRFRRTDEHRADPKSETVVLKIHQPYSNHNGGQLAFGPEGYLYIGMGDGGSANDPHGHGQNLNSLLGKLLRIDINREALPLRYTIPEDNPFIGKHGHRPEVWAYGLRNPWRFSFDALTKRLYLADVGQDDVEEIDVIERGGNYGWRVMEGDICAPGVNPDCDRTGLKPPIQVYRHPEGFSVTGGFVYRGNSIPGLCGVYLYADYVTGRLWGLRYDGSKVRASREIAKTPYRISSFGEDRNHEIYIADHAAGRILRAVAPGKGI